MFFFSLANNQAVYVAAAGNTAEKYVVTPDAGGLFDLRMVETSLASDLRQNCKARRGK
jgi:hypothetical protein